jgi:hypothetical protein
MSDMLDDSSVEELKARIQELQHKLTRGPGSQARASMLRGIGEMGRELERRAAIRERTTIRNLKLQTWAALIAAIAAIISAITPLGPWLRDIIESAWSSVFY